MAAVAHVANDPGLTIERLDQTDLTVVTETHDMTCHGSSWELEAEQETIETNVFCNPGRTSLGKITWTSTMDGYLSFGDRDIASVAGLFNILYPMQGEVARFTVVPDKNKVVGKDNPQAVYTAQIPIVPFGPGTVGEAKEVSLEFAVQTTPVITPALL